ncbi:hypothetical protein DRF75_04815 [Ehrlichia minasensis]|uniref:Uncharacterized protein n=1 Tax=Ehrlichia minasensis TaxID=1242993 RepID=A0A4Q6I370_9RICK|nr:hypothetical protein [Ehrlichia minasensis]RZB12315.1 hypothetical protein DRF75_04815 [Ehrlichia minasensis]CEI84928.1 Uncharacterized protein ehr_00302 [Ehrlichia minasensis]
MYQRKYSQTINEILEIIASNSLYSTDSLNLLLVIVPQIYNVPSTDNENYRYYHIIQHYTNEAYKNIQNKEQTKLLLKLWFKALIHKVSHGITIFPEDQKIIDKTLDKLFSKFRKINQYPTQQIKDKLYNKFRRTISKSNINLELKEFFQSYTTDISNLTKYKVEIINEIILSINTQDVTSLGTCHGITNGYSKNYLNIPISQKIKYLYQDIMKTAPIDLKHALELFPKKHIVFSIQYQLTKLHVILKDYRNRTEKFSTAKYPWYSIINNIKKVIYTYIVQPKLEKKTHILTQITSAFKESVAYGDTVFFFKQLKTIHQNSNISWNPFYKDINTLIKSLNNMEPRVQNIMTSKEFITNIKLYPKYEHTTHIVRNTKKQHFLSNLRTGSTHTKTAHNKLHKRNIIKKARKAISYTSKIAKENIKSFKNRIQKAIHNKRKKLYKIHTTPTRNFSFIDLTSSDELINTNTTTLSDMKR